MDLAGPGLHVIFGLPKREMKFTLNDALLNKITPRQAAIDLTKRLGIQKGKLVFVPAGYKAESIVDILKKGYELTTLRTAFEELSSDYSLDCLLIDTQPGIDKPTLLAIGLCDVILLITRIDKQDIFGSAVTLEVAKALNKPVYLVANMIPPRAEKKKMDERLERIFGVPVIAEIPYYPDVHEHLSSGIFLLENPDHEFSQKIKSLTKDLIELTSKQNEREQGPQTPLQRSHQA